MVRGHRGAAASPLATLSFVYVGSYSPSFVSLASSSSTRRRRRVESSTPVYYPVVPMGLTVDVPPGADVRPAADERERETETRPEATDMRYASIMCKAISCV